MEPLEVAVKAGLTLGIVACIYNYFLYHYVQKIESPIARLSFGVGHVLRQTVGSGPAFRPFSHVDQ